MIDTEGDEVAVTAVNTEPPVAPVNAIETAVLLERVTEVMVGVCGTVVAVIEFEALDAALVPAVDVAVTVNVYAVEDCSPVTVIGLEDPVPVNPPGELVTV